MFIAEVVVFRLDMMHNSVDRECAFEARRLTLGHVSLMMYNDPCPSQLGLPRGSRGNAGCILAHPIRRNVFRNYFSPVRFDGLSEERFSVTKDALAVKAGLVVINSCSRVNEMLIGPKV